MAAVLSPDDDGATRVYPSGIQRFHSYQALLSTWGIVIGGTSQTTAGNMRLIMLSLYVRYDAVSIRYKENRDSKFIFQHSQQTIS